MKPEPDILCSHILNEAKEHMKTTLEIQINS